jgi:Flp pilus assembly pilin Flp
MLIALGSWVTSVRRRPQGAQAMVEYALILVLIAVVVIVALTALGTGITTAFGKIVNSLK